MQKLIDIQIHTIIKILIYFVYLKFKKNIFSKFFMGLFKTEPISL